MTKTANNLYPVFMQLQHLRVLVVGAGMVGTEKLHSLLRTAPDARVTVIAPAISGEIQAMADKYPQVILRQKPFEAADLKQHDLVFAATNLPELNATVYAAAHASGLLINVADTPALCDFYLGSIVNKGELKIAISTNGKSPTVAKRMREVLQEVIPEEMESALENMQQIRSKLNGNFTEKVKKLNEVTAILKNDERFFQKETSKHWKRIAIISTLGFLLSVLVQIVRAYATTDDWNWAAGSLSQLIQSPFQWYVLAGFVAQLVDGMLSMGYGVTAATALMSAGVQPVAVSAAIHTSEIFTTGISGYSHYRFGNVNKKLFKHLVVPGVLGAILGALALVYLGEKAGKWLMPLIAAYALFLGMKILMKALTSMHTPKKAKRIGLLAWTGGFLDSFGGGGWGPIVTSTLIAKGRSPKYTIGSVSLTEFFITLSSAFTFLFTAGISHWNVVLGLIVGGVIAAPIGARLAGKLPRKTMLIAVGCMVIIWSIRMIIKSLSN